MGMFLPADETVLTGREAALMVVSVSVIVVGLWAAYRANGGVEGRDLAGRLFAVGWVLGLRLAVFWTACFALFFFLLTAAKREIPDSAMTGVAWGFGLVTEFVFFWRLAHHLGDVKRAV